MPLSDREPTARGLEVAAKRTLTSKTFDLGGGRFRLVTGFQPLHYEDGGELLDIDLTPRDDGDAWVIDRAPFILRIAKSGIAVEYEGRMTGRRLRFDHPGGKAVEFADGRAWWQTGTNNRTALQLRPGGIATEEWIDADAADYRWRWQSQGIEDRIIGRDAQKHPAEVVEKQFTGRVSKMVDEVTRRREWRAEPVWPVVLR